MSNAKHTPGPWEYVPSTDAHGPYVTSRYGSDVADCYTMTNPNHASVVNGGDSQPHHFCGEEADTNARLIAAAPELLEALVTALVYVEDARDDIAIKPGIAKRDAAKIRAAIAKAEGGAE